MKQNDFTDFSFQ